MATAEPCSAMQVPDHVPASLVRDIDCLDPPGAHENLHLAWRAVQASCPPLFWTPRNGGHWVATRGQDIREMQRNVALYSHAKYVVPYDPTTPQAPPATTDGPLHARYRALLVPHLLPAAVARLDPEVRQIARETIAALAPRGACEFVAEFARVLPVTVFLRLAGMPLEDREFLLDLAHRAARPVSAQDRIGALTGMQAYLVDPLRQREGLNGTDLISAIVNGDLGTRRPDETERLAIATTVMLGGLDTVAAMMSFVAWHLANHPRDREALRADPALLDAAVEEYIRRFGVANTARMVTCDHLYAGVLLRAGDQIMLPNSLVGLDDQLNPDPMEVDFHRARPRGPVKSRHAAFGTGPHTCPGAALARRELKIFLEEWLLAIPDFSVAADHPPRCAPGTINSLEHLHLVWPAGPVAGSQE